MKDLTYFIIIGILLMVLGFSISQVYNEYNSDKTTSSNIVKSDCKGLDLFNTSECLRNELSTFYKYNISEKYTDYSIERLKQFGGVCWKATQYYLDNFKSLGFDGKEITFWNENNTEGHSITLVYSKDIKDYCILDQENLIGCGSLLINSTLNNEKSI